MSLSPIARGQGVPVPSSPPAGRQDAIGIGRKGADPDDPETLFVVFPAVRMAGSVAPEEDEVEERRAEEEEEGGEEAPEDAKEEQEATEEVTSRQKHPSAGNNMVIYSPSEGFPRPTPLEDEEGLLRSLPFFPVAGEGVRFAGKSRDGALMVLSNYRLYVSASSSSPLVNVPLGSVETVELRDLFFLHLSCKDCRCYRVAMADNAVAEKWHARLRQALAPPAKTEEVFALAHFAWAQDEAVEEQGDLVREYVTPGFDQEVRRLQFDLEGSWRVTEANREYKLCETYPDRLIVPAGVTDEHVKVVAGYRAGKRIPAAVWRHGRTGAVLARCSQPEVGIMGWRSEKDEKFFEALAQSCHYDQVRSQHPSGSISTDASEDGGSMAEVESVEGLFSAESVEDSSETNGRVSLPGTSEPTTSIKDLTTEALKMKRSIKKVLIMDARSYAAAFGNRARGGGMECNEYYKDCEVEFMNLGNIHEIRKGFQRLRSLIVSTTDQSTWFSGLEATKWLYNISCLLSSAVRCAKALEIEHRPVVVHCSDGWDRTSQITSLAQILLDPYYRTMEGFEVLVEREWLSFGHKMADRNGGPFCTAEPSERCPIFLQWLDCVHQLLFQFPCAFQFNFAYLIKLARHTYSNLFGNFLYNSVKERQEHNIKNRTRSIWMYLRYYPSKYVNYLYNGDRDGTALWPKTDVRVLNLWQDVYTDFFAKQSNEVPPASNGDITENGVEAVADDTESSTPEPSGASSSSRATSADASTSQPTTNGTRSSLSSTAVPTTDNLQESESGRGEKASKEEEHKDAKGQNGDEEKEEKDEQSVISKESEACGVEPAKEAVELKDMKHLKVSD